MIVSAEPSIEELKERKVARHKCKESLLFSTRYLYKKIYRRRYIVRKHHQMMAEALEKVFKGEITRLIITIPPRYGKTELGVVNFMAHGLSLNPSSKFMHLSASASLALENSEKVRDLVKSESYRELFPEVRIKNSTDSKAKWYTEAGGGVYAAGAAGQVTGFGAGQTADDTEDTESKSVDEFISELEQKEGFAGAIVIDDPVKPDDADSDVKRLRVNNRYYSTIKSRLNSKKTPIIIIMQRLHELDLVGYVLSVEPDDWTVINIPALWVDEAGELQCLDPTKHTVADLVKMENSEDVEVRIVFQRQFQQNPKPREGLMFPMQDLQFYDPKLIDVEAQSGYSFSYTDPANKGGDSLASPIGRLIGDKIYLPEIIYSKDGTELVGPRIVDMIVRHKCEAAEVEANFNWYQFGGELRDQLAEVWEDCDMRLIKNTTNKHTRILAQKAFITKRFVFRSDWQFCSKDYRAFILNLTEYREIQDGASKNVHDDAPDAAAGMAKYFRAQFAHLW